MTLFVCVNDLKLRGSVHKVKGNLQLEKLMLTNHRVGRM